MIPKEKNIEILGEKLKREVYKHFGGILTIRKVDSGSCNGCEYEISALSNPFYNWERFGIKFVELPEYADAIMVTGCLTRNMYETLIKIYEDVPEPKFIIAVGDCSIDGGVFKGSYAILDGIKDKFRVDSWIKGCPPEPVDILYGLFSFMEKIAGKQSKGSSPGFGRARGDSATYFSN